MFSHKLFQFLTVGTITLVATGGGLSLTGLLHQNYLNNSSLFTQSLGNKLPDNLNGSALANAQDVAFNQNKEAIPKELQGQTIYQAKLPITDKVIALTFDDGPGPKNTTEILDILKKNHIKATFFVVGQMVSFHPQITKQIADDGHVLGNHTWHHWYRRMNVATAASEINRTADIIYKTTGVKTTLFRPPGGFLHNGLVDYAKSQKYAIMMWSDESGDSQRHGQAARLIKNVEKSAKPGGIILMHDGGGNRSQTVKALPQIIAYLKNKGYKFATIPELLTMQTQAKDVLTAESSIVTKDEHPNQKLHHQ
ncbi:polysaccharide deacetylase family protein [Nostoc sp. FACHB-152]|uniref:polysaccharide deacetylase family protein n=1 Tax=unclassified Nostoc TaxID=2593658 RepID=UPI0016865CFD|nr:MULTISPECIES: polysaccharide deacetylase family protein [unclassified Nostoc]MBD2447363.1 polysaccharide deacetylase family protein [Nostoc sp. FACHB-152]MBD2468035.1 polysaccharide deacetylase family protein [Nostoc sp. FACHB-145]